MNRLKRSLIASYVGLALLVLAAPAYGQITQTQCNIISGQNGLPQNTPLLNLTNRYQFNNNNNYCNVWTLTWWAPPSASIATVEIDGADDNGGVPGTWTAFPNTPTTGANPSQIGNEVTGIITVNGFKPWVSAVFFCMGSAPCGTVTFDLHGTASQAITPLSGSGINILPLIQSVGNATANIFNAGQTSHEMNIQIIQIPLKTCAAADFYQVSLSGVQQNGHTINLLTLEAHGLSAPTGGTAFGFATGLFPTYQVVATPFGSASTNCQVSVWYTGFPNIGFDAQSANTYGPSTNVQTYNIHPITECSQIENFSITAGTVVTLSGTGGENNGTVKFCQIVATTPTAAAIFTLGVDSAGTCATVGAIRGTFQMAVGVPITLGGNLGAFITQSKGTAICGQATTGNITGSITFDVL